MSGSVRTWSGLSWPVWPVRAWRLRCPEREARPSRDNRSPFTTSRSSTGRVHRRPDGVRAIDGTGRVLIPGLWDMHVHLSKIGEGALPLLVANGVTGVRDMGSDLAEAARWRDEIASGRRIGPRILTSGPMFESAANVARMRAEGVVEPIARTRIGVGSPQEAEAAVAAQARAGVDFLKVRTVASPEVCRALALSARRAGLALVGHATGLSPDDLLEAGQRSIEHFLYPLLDDWTEEARLAAFQRLAKAGVATVPTLVNGPHSLFVPVSRAAAIVEDAYGDIEPRRRYVSPHLLADWREQLLERTAPGPDWSRLAPSIVRNLKEMRRAGMPVLPGTDAAVLLIYPGFSLHDELELLVETVGMSEMDVLVAATRDAAAFLGRLEELGTVEVGKKADLVLLDADPLAHIANTRRIAGVLANGRWLDREERRRLLDEGQAR